MNIFYYFIACIFTIYIFILHYFSIFISNIYNVFITYFILDMQTLFKIVCPANTFSVFFMNFGYILE